MNAVPPRIAKPISANARFAGLVLGAVTLAIGAMIFFFNPTTHAFYPVCQFHQLTGLNCPGCGATRSLYALLHGHFSTALRDNALFVVALLVAAIYGIRFAVQKFRGRPVGELFSAHWLWPALAVALVFSVLRNLPAFSFLSPA
jgi:hypothetical protein